MDVLGLSASPRRDGNSFLLAEAAVQGAREAGHDTALVHLDDYVKHLLRDCRRCRDQNGRCTIDDGFESLLRDRVLPAEAIVLATPLYWYGVSGQLKAFLDRIFCYIAASEPEADLFVQGLLGKRLALVIASEESYPGASLGVIHEIQEYARYTHSAFVGVVQGIGNKRRDVLLDPGDPIGRARDLGRRLADLRSTDYRLDTDRANTTWPQPDGL
ncbi:MAG TPA: flavodoxin family protein [Thermoleophilaceae bacterium]|nr:flavodoxin family protein [Thermoleophilaceae bacterium]